MRGPEGLVTLAQVVQPILDQEEVLMRDLGGRATLARGEALTLDQVGRPIQGQVEEPIQGLAAGHMRGRVERVTRDPEDHAMQDLAGGHMLGRVEAGDALAFVSERY